MWVFLCVNACEVSKECMVFNPRVKVIILGGGVASKEERLYVFLELLHIPLYCLIFKYFQILPL